MSRGILGFCATHRRGARGARSDRKEKNSKRKNVAGTGAHQSDLRRRFPSFWNRRFYDKTWRERCIPRCDAADVPCHALHKTRLAHSSCEPQPRYGKIPTSRCESPKHVPSPCCKREATPYSSRGKGEKAASQWAVTAAAGAARGALSITCGFIRGGII